MIPLLLSLAVFGSWSLIGLALLTALRADIGSLRIALTAPVLGSAVTVLPLFELSHIGVAMEPGALPVLGVLVVGSIAILAFRRPRLPMSVVPVAALCVVDLLLLGRPMFHLGFRWIANANDDMANYVLSATQFLHHGLHVPLDFTGIANDRDYASALQALHNQGSRPGADLLLAAFAAVTRLPPYDLFMPLILAMSMCGISAAAALALQASNRWEAAIGAAALLVASPLAAFGVMQQLLPQVWALGIAAALFAMLMRPELHRRPGPAWRELVPIAVLTAALLVGYVELAAALSLSYVLYVALLTARRRLVLRAAVRVWGAALGACLVVLNSYFFRELHYVRLQATGGIKSPGTAALFGFTLVPAALPGILGFQLLPASATAHYLNSSILIAMALFAGIVVAAFATARRGVAAAVVLLGLLPLGILLGAVQESDFGLYKLYMYVQPFLAAAAAVWLWGKPRRPFVAGSVLLLMLVIVGVQLRNQSVYVNRSRDPIDLHHASAPDLLPKFRRVFAKTQMPVITVTENPTLGKLEAASVGKRPLYFISSFFFSNFAPQEWKRRRFNLVSVDKPHVDGFSESSHASQVLAAHRCVLVLPSGSMAVFNRRSFPEGSPDIVARSCGSLPHDLLVFTVSNLGEGFYLPAHRTAVSFYQLEHDYFYPHHTFSGFGRYVLFRILRPSSSVRLELALTTTLFQDGANVLPPAEVVGASRQRFPLVGRGSARVFSPPIRPQLIDGHPYVLLDMGVDGRRPQAHRSGLAGLYGEGAHVDPRFLTSYVRDVSLVSDMRFRDMQRPSALRRFPADLANPNLEYSGIYEDGWLSEDAYAVLASGASADLVIRAEVLPRIGQRLEVWVNGRRVASRNVKPGLLVMRVRVEASRARRRVELRWAGLVRLRAPDVRRAAARLKSLALIPVR